MKTMRKIIEINEDLCDGCGQCIIGCAEGAMELVDGKAKVISDNLCDGLGACIGECPTGALKIVEREAEEFDEEAVEEHLAKMAENKPVEEKAPCGCPSTHIQSLISPSPCQEANKPASFDDVQSALSHWPVKIRLVPPTAPFLKGADLLVLADCCGVAYANLHKDLLKGRVVMMGCPKFDNVQEYIEKFRDIFQTAEINSITSVVMEVPCCSGLPGILTKAMEKAGVTIPLEQIVISGRGQILKS
jgi:NAD-dependent dihydropyrimidine dehydrogenase PreA subunit